MKKTIIAFVALAFALAFAYFGPLGKKIPSPEEFKSAAAVQPEATAAGKPAKAAAPAGKSAAATPPAAASASTSPPKRP